MTTTPDTFRDLAEAYGSEQFAKGAESTAGELEQLTAENAELINRFSSERAAFEAYKKKYPPTDTFRLGMAYGSNTDPAPVEQRVGALVESRRTYYGAGDQTKAEAHVKANIAAGRGVSSISFKCPFSWADMAAGKGDAWATDIRDHLAKLTKGTGHLVIIAFHHEPEDEAKNDAKLRDAWKAMQVRLAALFEVDGFEFIVILMGYHSLAKTAEYYKTWRIDLAVPDSPHIKGVGYDLYETRGVIDKKTGKAKGWRNFATYFGLIKAFHDTRPGLKWGLSEYSHTELAETERPAALAILIALLLEHGGTWLEWFNSNLNSVAGWQMEPDSPRELAYAAALADNTAA